MKRVEKLILDMIAQLGEERIELTASGLVMLFDEIDLTPREAAWILKRLASEVIKDRYSNQNIYIINITELMQDEESGGILASE